MQRDMTGMVTGQRSTAHQGLSQHANQPPVNTGRGTGDTRPAFGGRRKPKAELWPAGITEA